MLYAARLLAHAGFDARDAVKFWENRSASKAECARAERPERAPFTERPHTEQPASDEANSLVRRIMGSGHPVEEVRVERLKEELLRWETERQAALARLQTTMTASV